MSARNLIGHGERGVGLGEGVWVGVRKRFEFTSLLQLLNILKTSFHLNTSITSSVCWLVCRLVGQSVGQSVGHARVENLEKKQKSLEMIQKYARMIPRCAIARLEEVLSVCPSVGHARMKNHRNI